MQRPSQAHIYTNMHVFKDFSFLQFYFMHMCCKQATIFLKLFVMIIIFNPNFFYFFMS